MYLYTVIAAVICVYTCVCTSTQGYNDAGDVPANQDNHGVQSTQHQSQVCVMSLSVAVLYTYVTISAYLMTNISHKWACYCTISYNYKLKNQPNMYTVKTLRIIEISNSENSTLQIQNLHYCAISQGQIKLQKHRCICAMIPRDHNFTLRCQ